MGTHNKNLFCTIEENKKTISHKDNLELEWMYQQLIHINSTHVMKQNLEKDKHINSTTNKTNIYKKVEWNTMW
jgi:hypothetical protein